MSSRRPDDEPVDRGVDDAWRAASTEQPGAAVDDALRDAARRELESGTVVQRTRPMPAPAPRRPRWLRYAPLAAAASVAAIAFVVIQTMPRDEFTSVTIQPPEQSRSKERPTSPQEAEHGTADASAPASSRANERAAAAAANDVAAARADKSVEQRALNPAPAAAPPPPPPAAAVRQEPVPEAHLEAPTPAHVEAPAASRDERDFELARKSASREAAPASPPVTTGITSSSSGSSGLMSPTVGAASTAQDLAGAARVDAAARIGIDVAAVVVVATRTATSVADAPGCVTADELASGTPIHVVELDVSGQRLRYRDDADGRLRVCPEPKLEPSRDPGQP